MGDKRKHVGWWTETARMNTWLCQPITCRADGIGRKAKSTVNRWAIMIIVSMPNTVSTYCSRNDSQREGGKLVFNLARKGKRSSSDIITNRH